MKKIFLAASVFVLSAFTTQIMAQAPAGLKVGDKAPAFEAKDQSGNTVTLAKALEKGPVVLVFYRGQWCPYCNKHLAELQGSLDKMKEKGASVMAISPETMENVQKSVAKAKVDFPVLHDENMQIMKDYQVNYKVEEKTLGVLKKYGIDLNASNGSNGENLPVPATYVVGKDGTIKYVFFNPDYSKRASAVEIMANL
jgi:peroxiredoxin